MFLNKPDVLNNASLVYKIVVNELASLPCTIILNGKQGTD